MKRVLGMFTVLCLLGNMSFGMDGRIGKPDMKRAPSFRILMNEKDEDVAEGKTQVKLHVQRVGAKVEIAYLGGDGDGKYKKLGVSDSAGVFHFTRDTGYYSIRVTKTGYQTAQRRLKFKSGHYVDIDVYLYKPRPVGVKKPAVYVYKPAVYTYANKDLELDIKIEPAGHFTFTYPEYKDGWHVTVGNNGNLTVDGRQFDYLFWEGEQHNLDVNRKEGFMVHRSELVSFMEEKLTTLGLNDREMNDFITYWGPQLQKSEYNYVNFVIGQDYDDKVGHLWCSETVDTEIRIFMAYEPLDGPRPIIEQELPTIKRSGLTIVEWGGGQLPEQDDAF